MLKLYPDHPLKKPALLFGLGVVLVLFFILWGQKKRDQGLAALETLQRRLEFSQAGPVAPSAAVLASLQEANRLLGKSNDNLNRQLFASGNQSLVEFGGNSTAAYFELAGFVEEMSRRFSAHGISLPEAVRFGFAQFEQQGPDPEILTGVMSQKDAAEALLEPLLKAKPVGLVALNREFLDMEPVDPTLLQQAAGSRQSRRTRPADTIEAGAKHDGFESYSFELIFEGYTESLRRYLKGILEAPIPVVVTGLEVRPLDRFGVEDGANSSATSSNPFDLLVEENGQDSEGGPVPIIRNNLSSFKLQLEVFSGKEADPGT